jgi:hypothetical protein
VSKLNLSASTTISVEKELRKPERVTCEKSATMGSPTNAITTPNNKKMIKDLAVLLSIAAALVFCARAAENV